MRYLSSVPVVVLLICLLLAAETASAQAPARSAASRFWVGAGVGIGTLLNADNPDTDESLAGSLNATYQFGRNVLSARTATAGELFGDSFFDIGLLYGREVLSEGMFFGAVAAGVAYVDGTRSAGLFSDPEAVEATIGLPLELQLYVRPARFVGVGLYGFANINPEEHFLGVTLSIQAGRLRR